MTSTAVDERRSRLPRYPKWWPLALLVVLFHAALGYWVVATLTSAGPRVPQASERSEQAALAAKQFPVKTTVATPSRTRFSEITGLEVQWVAVSAAGGILDLRYRVVNEKTAESHSWHQSTPAIIDARTGKTLTKQWMGHAHPPDSFNDDRSYWMLFLNPNELVKRGDMVAIRLGHARLTGVRVR